MFPLIAFCDFSVIRYALQIFSEGQDMTWQTLPVFAFPMFLLTGVNNASESVTISLSEIIIKRPLWRKAKNILWSSLCTVRVKPNFFGSYAAELVACSGSGTHVINTYFYRNHNEVTKALIEAANIANPQIEIEFMLSNEYGSPPYGIFNKETNPLGKDSRSN